MASLRLGAGRALLPAQHPAPSLFQNAFFSAGGVNLPSPGQEPAALHPRWHKAALQEWLSHRPHSIFWQFSPNFANFPPASRAGPSTVISLSSSLSKSEAKSSPGFVLVLSSPTPLCISIMQLCSGAAAFATKNQSSSCSPRLRGFIGAGSDPIKGSEGFWSCPLPSPRPWGGEGTHRLARLTMGTPSRRHPGPELPWGWGGLDVAPLPRVTLAASRTPGWGQGCLNPKNCCGTTQSSRHPLSLGRSLKLEAACRNLPLFS